MFHNALKVEEHHFIEADVVNKLYAYKMAGPDPIGEIETGMRRAYFQVKSVKN